MAASWRAVVVLLKPANRQAYQQYRQLSAGTSASCRASVNVYEDDQLAIRAEQLPRALWRTMQQLRAGGHMVLLVGGAVRDLLLGIPPKDYDLLTSAHLAQVKQLVPEGRVFGRNFPICQLDSDGVRIEVSSVHTRAPLRLHTADHTGPQGAVPPDAAQILQLGPKAAIAAALQATMVSQGQIGRHQRSMTGARNQQLQQPQLSWAAARRENALGRDFTVNCLLYDPFAGLLFDYAGGVLDVQAKLLRCNGHPDGRFSRDPACMLRAVRCAARAGLTIEAQTLTALQRNGQLLSSVNRQRLSAELLALLGYGAAAPSVQLLAQAQLLQHILPHHAAYMSQHARSSGQQHRHHSGMSPAHGADSAADCSSSSSSRSGGAGAEYSAATRGSESRSATAASQLRPQPLQSADGDSSRRQAPSALCQLWTQLNTAQQAPQQQVQQLQQQRQQLDDANVLLRVLAALDQQVSVSQPASSELILACLTAPLLVEQLSDALQQLAQPGSALLQLPQVTQLQLATMAGLCATLQQQEQQQVTTGVSQATADRQFLLRRVAAAHGMARPFSSISISGSSCNAAEGTHLELRDSSHCSPAASILVQQLLLGVPFQQCLYEAACETAAMVCGNSALQDAAGEQATAAHQLFGLRSPELAAGLLQQQLLLSKQEQQHNTTMAQAQQLEATCDPVKQHTGNSSSVFERSSSSAQQIKQSSSHADLWDDYAAALPRSNKQFKRLMQRQWGQQQVDGLQAGFVGSIPPEAVLLAGSNTDCTAGHPRVESTRHVAVCDSSSQPQQSTAADRDDSHLLHQVLRVAGVDLLHYEQQLTAAVETIMGDCCAAESSQQGPVVSWHLC